jgi:saccharopine dehydrogenase (NAD+, L-lysine-forming)
MYKQIYKIIYLRCEENYFEMRTPIVPKDIIILKEEGFTIYIETSTNRIYKDDEYELEGAIITTKKWYDPLFKNALIVGLKNVVELDKLSNHNHMYFSHTYKNQKNSKCILSAFTKSNSIIYDFEYFTNIINKRIISFGIYAGKVGCILALLQYRIKNITGCNINNISYWDRKDDIIHFLKLHTIQYFKSIDIAIIGSNGNCGEGVREILDELKIKYTIIGRNYNKNNLKKFDIIYNCINLSEDYNEIWFDNNTNFDKPIIICDISCDYSKPNNPIKLYSENTTWQKPVFCYNEYVDIIAINNLPSLLPKESSDYFSSNCVNLIKDLHNDTNDYWKNNEKIYFEKIKNISM